MISPEENKAMLSFQRNEITEHFVYLNLSRREKKAHNKEVLKRISDDELRHYGIWKKFTGRDVKPDRFKVWWYSSITYIFGVTFAIKLMEAAEGRAQDAYCKMIGAIPEAQAIQAEEEGHEKELVAMIDEDRLKYIGSVVLGLNDALVELSGTMAGLTFALQNTRIVGMAGLITGIAASLSMAASEYLSTKSETGGKNPLKASFYTGVAYVMAVAVLIVPYFVLHNYFLALLCALIGAVMLIFIFTFYFSVVREMPFRKRFIEMLSISLGVAALSFLIGLAVRYFLGIDI